MEILLWERWLFPITLFEGCEVLPLLQKGTCQEILTMHWDEKENLNPKRLLILLMLLMKRCHEMQTKYPKTKTKLETYEIPSFANVVNQNFDNDDNIFFIITDPKFCHF